MNKEYILRKLQGLRTIVSQLRNTAADLREHETKLKRMSYSIEGQIQQLESKIRQHKVNNE